MDDDPATLSQPYRQFAEQHELTYVERGTFGLGASWGARRTLTDFVGGPLPGRIVGVLARAEERCEATIGIGVPEGTRSKRVGDEVRYIRDATTLMTRVPEAALFLPSLSCRDAEAHGLADKMFGPGGWIPIMEQFELESIQFNRRYRIGVIRGGSEVRVRRLFSPSFIDWMAAKAPARTLFELWGGFLAVTIGGLIEDPGELERVCQVAASIAERIRSEALEDEPAGAAKAAMTTLTPDEQKSVAELDDEIAQVQFDSPPTEVRGASRRFRKLAAEIGRRDRERHGLLGRMFLGAFHRTIDRSQANKLALEAVMRAYAQRHGLKRGSATAIWTRVLSLLVPVGRAPHALVGNLPGTTIPGTLAVMGDRKLLLLVLLEPQPQSLPATVRVTPKRGDETLTIGGYPIYGPEGVQSISAADREAAALATRVAGGQLSPYYEVIVGGSNGAAPDIPGAAAAWLLDPARRGHAMLVADGGALALLVEGPTIEEFSAAMLDDFCTSVAPVLGAFEQT